VQTALTIANTDIKLVVNGGASANKNSGGATHRVNGNYGVTFDATDTATVGEMEVNVLVSGALIVFDKFYVIEGAIFDSLYAASAAGFDANQRVNVGLWLGTAPLALSSQQVQAVVPSSTVVASVTGAVGSVTGAVGSVTGAVGSVTGNVGGNVVGSVASVTGAVGSVTGNVGGNVVGSVASVTGAVGSVTGNVGGNLVGTLSTTERNAISDAMLDRNMATGTDSGTTTIRTMRQALRFLRNKWSITGGTLTVCKEDDTTSSWTGTVTQTAGNPVSTIDPAG
jgi:hypothetical protein